MLQKLNDKVIKGFMVEQYFLSLAGHDTSELLACFKLIFL